VQALSLLIEQRLTSDVAHFAGHARINVLPPLCPLAVSSVDFRHAAELIERARTATRSWLDSGGPSLPDPARFLSLHDHTRTVTPPTDEHECTAAPEPDRAAGHPAAA
jgi:NTE family protein